MNPPVSIFARANRRASPSTAPPSPGPKGAETSPPAEVSAPTLQKITALDVQLAEAKNEPNATVTLRELDEQIVHERDAGHDGRVALLAEHRVRIMRRRQAEAFPPDDPGPIAA